MRLEDTGLRLAVTSRAVAPSQPRLQPAAVPHPQPDRFTTASLALDEVVQLLNPNHILPYRLFPHGIHITRLTRMRQALEWP